MKTIEEYRKKLCTIDYILNPRSKRQYDLSPLDPGKEHFNLPKYKYDMIYKILSDVENQKLNSKTACKEIKDVLILEDW
jgi:hypothetical protein